MHLFLIKLLECTTNNNATCIHIHMYMYLSNSWVFAASSRLSWVNLKNTENKTTLQDSTKCNDALFFCSFGKWILNQILDLQRGLWTYKSGTLKHTTVWMYENLICLTENVRFPGFHYTVDV